MSYIFDILALTLVGTMLALVFVVTRFVSEAQYNGYGIYHLTINAYLRGRKDYRSWLKDNTVYLWSTLLVIALIVMTIGLVGAFSHNIFLDRPIIIAYVGPVFYLSLLMCFRWFIRRTKF